MAACSQVSGFTCPPRLPENSNGKFSVARGMVGRGLCKEETAGYASHRDAPLHTITLQFYGTLGGSLNKGMPLFSLQKPELGKGWEFEEMVTCKSSVTSFCPLHAGKREWPVAPGETVPSLAVRCSPRGGLQRSRP